MLTFRYFLFFLMTKNNDVLSLKDCRLFSVHLCKLNFKCIDFGEKQSEDIPDNKYKKERKKLDWVALLVTDLSCVNSIGEINLK